jgi:hypothetical protein
MASIEPTSDRSGRLTTANISRPACTSPTSTASRASSSVAISMGTTASGRKYGKK